MKKKTVTILAIAHSKRVCDPQPEFIDRMEVRRLVMNAYRAGYNKAKTEESLIDWEERRFELIKVAIQGNIPTSAFDKETFCKYCISIVDEMITQLNS